MSNKKYYWLRLQNDFFKRHDIKIIESMPNGKDYVLFYLKLIIESMNHEGRLRFSETIPYDHNMLATVTNTNADIVKSAINLFCELGLMELWDDKTIYLVETKKMVGDSTSTERVRKHRAKLKNEEVKQLGNVSCNVSETVSERKSETELDIELELEIDINNTKDIVDYDYKSVIEYLCEVTGKNFRNVEAHRKHIRARYNEGYTLEDFKKVIEIKNEEWKDSDMSKYIQPSTLFGSKFDQYLNQEVKVKEKANIIGDYS